MKGKVIFAALGGVIMIALVLFVGCARTGTQVLSNGAAAAPFQDWFDPLAVSVQANTGRLLAPNFPGVDVFTGQTISMQQFTGKVVLLNFANYGCSQSLNNVVSVQILAIRPLSQQRTDFVPLSLFCGCCPASVLRDHVKANNFNWLWIMDSSNSIVAKYNTHFSQWGYPTLIYIDRNGNIKEATGTTDLTTIGQKLDKINVNTAVAS